MINAETEARIVRLFFAERWPVGTIARQLGLHHSTVRRALRDADVPPTRVARRACMLDPFLPFVLQVLQEHPRLPASRLFEMVRQRGYAGRPDHFRAMVARHRPRRPAEAFLRLRTLPGEEGQVDWAHFGTVAVPGGHRPLVAFVLVLSWSRMAFVRFGLAMKTADFLHHHAAAFDAFGGVPRRLLYDNLKSAVLERQGDAIRFNDNLLAFAAHHRYEPRPVAPYRGNEKGRVERLIRYVRDSFFAARTWTSLDDLNAQAMDWCKGLAADRPCPEDRARTVRDVFHEEKGLLLPLPDDRFPADESIEVAVGKTPYVRFDLNDYSVPHTRVKRALLVSATPDTVRVLDGLDLVAEHKRAWGRGRQVEDPGHLAPLIAQKAAARQARGLDRLVTAVPRSKDIIAAAACRGINLGGLTNALHRLLEQYGAEELDRAIDEVVTADAPHASAVRQVLERRRHARGQPPVLPVSLPDNPRVRDISVRPHALNKYDTIQQELP